jgi:hypothetical protein
MGENEVTGQCPSGLDNSVGDIPVGSKGRTGVAIGLGVGFIESLNESFVVTRKLNSPSWTASSSVSWNKWTGAGIHSCSRTS